MLYHRKYIMTYLESPGVFSFTPDIQSDFDLFYHKYYDPTDIRTNKGSVKAQLVKLLKGMAKDGVLNVESKRMRVSTRHNIPTRVNIYSLKDDGAVLMSQHNIEIHYKYIIIKSKSNES